MQKNRLLLLIFICFFLFGCGFTFALPEIQVPEASVLYDINGTAIKGLADQNRISIGLEEIPDSFREAIVAVEDKNFYNHHGIDLAGIARAFITNIKAGRIAAGGSTITQQTAKNLFLSNERTFSRKFKELFYALQLERKYSKDEIMTLYCNTIYFGQGAYGLEVASRTFFAKSAADLAPQEAALLAGLPNSPSAYNPYEYPEKARERQKVVLERMVQEGYLTDAERQQLLEQPLDYRKGGYVSGEAPYFTAMVKEYLTNKYGERMVYQGGMKIYTTLDLEMQKAANRAMTEGMSSRDSVLQAALVAVDPANGQIRALIGGRDYGSSTYNRVFAMRQPGSTFKPFMYSLAIARGMTEADMVPCEEIEFEVPGSEPYRPTDYGDEPYHWRDFTLKEAVMISDNVVAVQVNSWLGPEAVARYAETFGFEDIKPVLSLPLGSNEVTPLQMAAAYAVFANQGVYCEPRYILKVVDQSGRVLEESRLRQQRVTTPENAFIITDMLKGVLQPGGTGSHLQSVVGRAAAGKTGTTDEYKDAWFAGYTPQLCCAVWVGYDQNTTVNLAGGVVAGPIWANFIREASTQITSQDFPKPEQVILVPVCLDTGQIACESCPRQIQMAFLEGTEPAEICYEHRSDLEWLLDILDNDREKSSILQEAIP